MPRHRFHSQNIAPVLFLVAAFATGCTKNVPTAAWTLALKVDPDHPRMVRPATFSVHITDSAGKPVENAQVTGSLNMTLMDMGKTEVKFEPKGDGNYEATINSFDMSGPWELAVDARQGSTHATKKFAIVIYD